MTIRGIAVSPQVAARGEIGGDAELRRRATVAAFAGLCAALILGLVPVAADAAFRHVPGPAFDLAQPNSTPASVAVDEASGSVYVLRRSNPNNGAIEKFDESGNPVNFAATGTNLISTGCEGNCRHLAVDNSGGPNQGVIYVGNTSFGSQGVEVFLPSGAKVGNVTARTQTKNNVSPCGVAVADDGDLIVAHPENSFPYSYVDRLEPLPWATNAFHQPAVVGVIGSDFTQPCKTAVDAEGGIVVIPGNGATATGAARRFAPAAFGSPTAGGYKGGEIPTSFQRPSVQLDPGPNAELATDSNGDIYLARTSAPIGVRRIAVDGSPLEAFASEVQIPAGIAVARDTGVVFVADRSTSAEAKDIYTYTRVTVPDVVTGAAVATDQDSFVLKGEVDPVGAGDASECRFEYVTEAAYNSSQFSTATQVPCEETTITEAEEVSAEVSGLTLEQRYRYRLVAENANGPSSGRTRTFVPHAVVGLETEPVTGVSPRAATLHASFLGNGDATTHYFEYGPTTAYGSTTPVVDAGSPNGPVSINVPIQGLEPETTYNVRIVAENGTGVSRGENVTFTTPPAVAGVQTKPATDVSFDSITLNGEFEGDGDETTYYFEYGPTDEFGSVTAPPPGISAGAPTGPKQVSATIEDFTGFSTYHYRLVAVNSEGTTYGQTMTVDTPETPKPEVGPVTVTDVGRTGATFTASVNPNRWPTAYLFEYGTTTEYGSQTEIAGPVGGLGHESIEVSAKVDDLEPGSVQHVRLVAINFAGTTNGPDGTFITPDLPALEPAAVTAVGQTTARVEVRAAGNGSPASVALEYGPGPGLGQVTPPRPIGDSLVAQPVAIELAGLAPGTTYHARPVGTNGLGRTEGGVVTFTTAPAPPTPAAAPKKARRGCKKGFVKRRGKCVKRKRATKRKKSAKKKQRRGKGKSRSRRG